MTITATEAGLAQIDYQALQAQQDAYSYKVIVERQNLAFDLFGSYGSSIVGIDDAIVLDGYIFTATGLLINRITLTDGSLYVPTPIPPSQLVAKSKYTFATNASVLYVFAATATGVQQISTSNYGVTWSAWSTIWSTADQTIYTGNLARDGVAAASSSYTSSTAAYPASNAFDHQNITQWITPIGTTTGTLSYNFAASAAQIITRYKITASGTTAPRTWTFQGSHNGSSWTTIDTIASSLSWGSPETRVFNCTNSTAYEYYRLNITVNNGATQLSIYEFTIHATSADEAVILVAAATYQRVHFIYVDGATKTYYPYVADKSSGSWVVTSSGFALTDRPYNLTVATISTKDYLLLETNIAGRVVDALDDLVLTSNRIKSGGLICFHYKTDAVTWSTHYPVDVLDEVNASEYMSYSHIKNLNGTLHVTVTIRSGTPDHPVIGLYDYSSTDGTRWSTRSRLFFDTTQTTLGIIMLQTGEYVYGIEQVNIWRSLSTRFVGYTALVLQEDISKYVDEWSYSQYDLGQLSLMIDNADGYFTNHAFISNSNKLLFTLKFGGFVNGVELLYPLGYFEMDTYTTGETVPEHMIQISARDYMGRMVDKVNASEFRSYDSYLVGMDQYLAKNNQNKGGLAHLYTVSGQIDNGVGTAVMSNGEGLGFSTFGEDIWNGEISCGINATGANAKAGLVFRGKNGNQFWAFLYDYSTDKVKLYKVNGDVNGNGLVFSGNELYVSSALSWTGTIGTVLHYLRVRFLYGEIKCYTSTDNVTWTLKTTYIMDCSNKQAPDSAYYSDPITDNDPCERGSVGIYGLGVPGTNFAAIAQFRLNDFTLPLTVENAFSAYASFARIHDHEYVSSLKAGNDSWATGLGMTVTVDTGLATGYYNQDVYDGALYG